MSSKPTHLDRFLDGTTDLTDIIAQVFAPDDDQPAAEPIPAPVPAIKSSGLYKTHSNRGGKDSTRARWEGQRKSKAVSPENGTQPTFFGRITYDITREELRLFKEAEADGE